MKVEKLKVEKIMDRPWCINFVFTFRFCHNFADDSNELKRFKDKNDE